MNCPKCNIELKETDKFCPNCGEKLIEADNKKREEQTAPPAASAPEPENVEQETKKKKKSVLGIIAVILIIALLSTISVLAVFYLTQSPEDRYIRSELAAIDKLFGYVDETAEKLPEVPSASGTVSLTVSDKLVKAFNLSSYIGNIRNITIDTNMNGNQRLYGFNAAVMLEGVEIVNVDATMDFENGVGYLTLPGYAKKGYQFEIEKDFEEYSEKYLLSNEEHKEFISNPKLSKTVKDALKAALKQINITEDKKATVTAGEVTQNCIRFTAAINQQTLADMTEAILNELKSNKHFDELVVEGVEWVNSFAGEHFDISSEQVLVKIEEYITELSRVIAEAESSDKVYLQYSLYTDKKGNAIAREFTLGDIVLLRAVTAQNGQDIAIDYTFGTEDMRIGITGGGKIIDGGFNGTIYCDVNSSSLVEFSFDGFKYNNDEIKATGTVIARFGEIPAFVSAEVPALSLLDTFEIKYVGFTEDSGKVTVISEGDMLFELAISGSESSDYKPTIPNSEQIPLETNILKFATGIDITEIVGNLISSGLSYNIISSFLK